MLRGNKRLLKASLFLIVSCSQPTQEEPVPTDWPEPPKVIALDRNWQGRKGGSFLHLPVIGTVACRTVFDGELVGNAASAWDLSSGEKIWQRDLPEGGGERSYLTDGEYFYVDYALANNQTTSEYTYNHLSRLTLDGEISSLFYVIPGYEKDYKNPALNGLRIENFLPYYPQVYDKVFYFSITSPSLRNPETDSDLYTGGLYALDFRKVQETAVPGEYVVVLEKVFERTNPNTRFDQPVVAYDSQGKKLLIFAEVFQAVGRLPPSTLNVLDLVDFCRENVALHCIEADTGKERWKFVDPWLFEWVTLTVWKDKIWASSLMKGFMLRIEDGSVVWNPEYYPGEREYPGMTTLGSHVIVGDVAYCNRDTAGNPTSLAALDLNTGRFLWTRYQKASEGYGIFERKGVLYVINQDGMRLYRASDGKYLAYDGSFFPAAAFQYPNKNFVWNEDNLITIGGHGTISFKMNWVLDSEGNLIKE